METLKGKKLLILAGAAVHCKVVEAAKAMGVYTVVTDYLDNSPAKVMADEGWDISITDVDAIVARCREQKIDGVLNFCIDPAQRPYVAICEKLGLPCYGTAEQVYIMTDKPAFKRFCMEHGLSVIPSYTKEDVEKESCQYPLFIKPTDSRGSRGQAVCYRKEEALEAIACAAKESSDGGVVIEKYMQGKQDFSMTYFVCDGTPYLCRTCDRYLGRIEDGLNKQCVGCIGPSQYSDLYLEKVHARVVDFIKALGIQNGPVFMQGFVDEDTVRFYDPGLRFPGGEYERLLKQITGVDLMSALVEFALSGRMTLPAGMEDQPYLLCGYHTIQLPITARPGVIHTMEGMEAIAKDPRVTVAFTRYVPGECVPATGDVRQRVYEAALVTRPDEDVREAVRFVQSQLKVLDECGENMLVSLVEPSELNYSKGEK